MNNLEKEYILVFSLNELKLSITQCVIHALQIASLPGAPTIVDGLLNLEGNTLPVINIRKRLNLEFKKIVPSDKIIGIVVINNEIVLIHDVNKFLSLWDKKKLKIALKKNSN